MFQKLITISTTTLLIALLAIQQQQIEARRIKSINQIKCKAEECQLPQTHLILYSFIRKSIDNNFDLRGKEILPLLKSIEVLQRRYKSPTIGSSVNNNNSTSSQQLIKSLLNDEKLADALKVFYSDDGKSLINLYRASINGKGENLACSEFRINDIERASKKLNSDQQFKKVFGKIHKNFIKKSVKKCLKHSCNSIDLSMSRIDSAIGSSFKNRLTNNNAYFNKLFKDDNNIDQSANINQTTPSLSSNNNNDLIKREFDSEEQELCRFFKRSNETNCAISGRELNEISFKLNNGKIVSPIDDYNNSQITPINDFMKDYYFNSHVLMKQTTGKQEREQFISSINTTIPDTKTKSQIDEAKKTIVGQCLEMRNLLDYNMLAIKWYRKNNYIDNQKIDSRTIWCPSLHYWLQIDRLCGQLENQDSFPAKEDTLKEETFHYEVVDVTNNKKKEDNNDSQNDN